MLGSLLLIFGCAELPQSPAAHHDHDQKHDHAPDKGPGDHEWHPETFAEAVEEVVRIDQAIRGAFAAKDDDGAHELLHEVGHLLEDVVVLAAKVKMNDEQRKSVRDAVDSLFELYGAVDAAMHGGEGKSYDEVSAQIDEALDKLKNAPAADPQKVSTNEVPQ